MSVTLPSKEMEELRRRFKDGYTVERLEGDHYAVIDPQGNKVTAKSNGKILSIPGTPHGGRQTKNVESELRKAGVLKTEAGPAERKTASQIEGEKRRIEALNRTTAERSKRRQKVADALYERMVAVLAPLGGFEQRGMQADLAKIAAKFAREHGPTSSGRMMTEDLFVGSMSRVANRHWVEPRYQEVWTQVAEHLENADDVTEEFFALVREVRGLPEAVIANDQLALPSGDWPFTVELIPISLLFLDHAYQRPPDWPFVRRNAMTFDARLVGTIDVSQRKQGEVYAILDGQQRYEMMRLVGKTTVWCSIYQGLDLEAEARFFLHKNRDKKAIHPYYTFRARMTANDPDAIEIDRITKKLGYKIAITNSAKGGATENHISAIAALEETHKRKTPQGREALTPTLTMLKKTTFGRRSGQQTNLIRGLGRFYSLYPSNGTPFNNDRLAEVIAARGPEWLLSAARDESQGNNSTVELKLVRVLVNEYNRGLPRGERLPHPWQAAAGQ